MSRIGPGRIEEEENNFWHKELPNFRIKCHWKSSIKKASIKKLVLALIISLSSKFFKSFFQIKVDSFCFYQNIPIDRMYLVDKVWIWVVKLAQWKRKLFVDS